MVVNAALHVAALLLLVHFLKSVCRPSLHPALFGFAGFFFAIPHWFDNALVSFQAQFYFVLLFGTAFLWAIARYAPFSLPWLLGLAGGALCFFSFSAGAVALAAGVVLIAVRWLTAAERSRPALWGGLLLALFCGAALALTPGVPGHAAYKAGSLLEFFYAAAMIAAWPCTLWLLLAGMLLCLIVQWRRRGPLFPALILPFAVYAPMARFMFNQWRRPPKPADAAWFLFAMCLWQCGQILAISYGRGQGPLASRYFDLFAVGVLLNFACLSLWRQAGGATTAMRRYWGLWIAVVAIGLAVMTPHMLSDIARKAREGQEQEKNTRAYLMTGDYSHLRGKPAFAIPYPDAEHLKFLLDQEAIRDMLPASINPAQKKQEPEAVRSAVQWLLKLGPYSAALGALLLLLCAFASRKHDPR